MIGAFTGNACCCPVSPPQLLNSVCMVPSEEDRKFFAKPLVSRKNRYPDKHPCEIGSAFLCVGGCHIEGATALHALCAQSGVGWSQYTNMHAKHFSSLSYSWTRQHLSLQFALLCLLSETTFCPQTRRSTSTSWGDRLPKDPSTSTPPLSM